MRTTILAVLGIIVACCDLVNAASPALTEKQSVRRKQINDLKRFIHHEGSTAPLARNGENHGLRRGTKIKYVEVKKANLRRICDLIYDESDGELTTPNSILLLDRTDRKEKALFTDYRFDLNGNLLSAAIGSGQKDTEGNPIKGSLTTQLLDPKSKDVIASANKALDYWLSGEYKKHMPMKKGGAAPESAKKHAATTAR